MTSVYKLGFPHSIACISGTKAMIFFMDYVHLSINSKITGSVIRKALGHPRI